MGKRRGGGGWVAGALGVATLAVAQGGCSSAAPVESTGTTSEAVDTICNEAASATLDGFPAYAYCGNFNVWTNNGVDTRSTSGGAGWVQTEGGYGYQCVEWAARYFYFKWNVPHGWPVAYAKDMCATHPSGVSTTTSPVHGDLAVFSPGACGADATAGHVAAINTVGASTISVVQENPAGTMTWNKSCVMCYLHAASNGSASDPCSTAPVSGFYCGQSTQWGGGQKDVLYDCEGGVTKTKTPCPYGCHLEPVNTNDVCYPAPADAGGSAGSDGGSDAAVASDGAPHDDAAPVNDAGHAAGDAASTTPHVDASEGEGGDWATPTASTGSKGGCQAATGTTRDGAFAGVALLLAMTGLRRRRRMVTG